MRIMKLIQEIKWLMNLLGIKLTHNWIRSNKMLKRLSSNKSKNQLHSILGEKNLYQYHIRLYQCTKSSKA